MKLRIAFAAWAIVVAAILTSCSVPNSPEGAAQQVLGAINKLDFTTAKKFVTADALDAVNSMELLFGEMSDAQKGKATNQSFTIGKIEEQDKETLVNYKLGDRPLVLSAVKDGQDWKVSKVGYEQMLYLVPNNPTAITEAFIAAFNAYNVEMAAPFASTETQKTISAISSFFKQMGKDDLKAAPKQPHPTILESKETGNAAVVRYKIGDTGKEQTVNLVKVDDIWKVDMKKDS